MTLPALITGASRGLGAAFAETLAGDRPVIAVARTQGALEELDDRIKPAGGEAVLAPMDVTNDGAMQTLCRTIHDRWGGLSLWLHCAIYAAPLSPADHVAEKEMDRSLATNVAATARLIRYVSPLLKEGGRAVFFDDPRGGEKFFAAYGATKRAQIGLAEHWRAESMRVGPTVLILRPRPMATAVRARFHPGEDRTALADPREEAARLLAEITG
ncbi:SDR family NAD(P)-dependent oxidoreductase [Wenxinia marina]|uniref:Short-chain dehydrogenase n=1 Tax=Wenxinia marina DSM 24838 TaxID=1123501 RepID=A0A0D0PB19_9RHOB|nr:SDR family oxidoreductase [Wenxinia marina]KIQ68631.1 Short-chain alcohol dehydrogenase of unknown specificity [Wenxinia marina DSM 24838]GGL67460.1 oxidoreductase [Wenxinia marina]